MKQIIYILSVFCLFASCDNGKLADLNVDPNAANTINPGYLFANTQLEVSNRAWQTEVICCAMMSGQMASLETYYTGDKYVLNQTYATAMWDLYTGTVKKLVNLKRDLTAPEDVNKLSAVRIWSALVFSKITDIFGDVPYKEAGLGYIENNIAPAYELQKDIYTDLLNEIDEAINAFDENKKTFGIQDIVYQGDIAKWKAFANSLMLRLALRVADADQALAKKYIKKAIDNGLITNNSDALIVDHFEGGEGFSKNAIGENLVKELDAGKCTMGKVWIDWLKSYNDPRLQIVALPTADGQFRGLPNGYIPVTITKYEGVENVDIKTFYSQFNQKLFNANTPNILLSYAEVELMVAECIERGFAIGDAETHYKKGVTAAMKDYTIYNDNLVISDDQIAAYLEANPYNADQALKMINEQYWAATYLNWSENYSNMRRSDYPVLPDNPYSLNETDSKMPNRLVYPIGETNSNFKHYTEAVSRMKNGNVMTEKVWWDVK